MAEDIKELVKKEVAAVMKKEEKAKNKPNDRGVRVPPHLQAPYAPENIHLNKAQFIAKRKEEKEKALKVAEYADSLNKKAEEQKTPEVEKDKKKSGRPKRIE